MLRPSQCPCHAGNDRKSVRRRRSADQTTPGPPRRRDGGVRCCCRTTTSGREERSLLRSPDDPPTRRRAASYHSKIIFIGLSAPRDACRRGLPRQPALPRLTPDWCRRWRPAGHATLQAVQGLPRLGLRGPSDAAERRSPRVHPGCCAVTRRRGVVCAAKEVSHLSRPAALDGLCRHLVGAHWSTAGTTADNPGQPQPTSGRRHQPRSWTHRPRRDVAFSVCDPLNRDFVR